MLTSNEQLLPITMKKKNEIWEIAEISISYLAEKYGTPLYILDKETLIKQAKSYINSWSNHSHVPFKVLFAVKALPILEVIRIFNKEGLGFLVSTVGELFITRKAGVNPKKIYFHGNAKTLKELEYAIEENIYALIVDNFDEIEKIKFLVNKKNKEVNILVRIIPNIEADTHKSIRTGQMDTKFGLPINDALSLISSLKNEPFIKFKGIHSHIGSQIFDLNVYVKLAEILIEVGLEIKKLGINLEEISIGGGLGIAYTPQDSPPYVEDLAKYVSEIFKEKFPYSFTLICEPGRSLVGRAGITLYRVESRKTIANIRNYVAVDGGMSDNIRPSLYGARYTPLFLKENNEKKSFRLVGKHCESGDILIQEVEASWPNLGDLVVILSTGAYNFSMFTWYNAVLRPAVVMVENGKDYLVVERDKFEDLVRGQK
ncbi:MAG: diaminopimelate decarboxylase [Dictyoglomaceae bacterium]|nr:diaminopimelate decarboxylase [Dictyoglomaceae bacterium]